MSARHAYRSNLLVIEIYEIGSYRTAEGPTKYGCDHAPQYERTAHAIVVLNRARYVVQVSTGPDHA